MTASCPRSRFSSSAAPGGTRALLELLSLAFSTGVTCQLQDSALGRKWKELIRLRVCRVNGTDHLGAGAKIPAQSPAVL